MKTESIRFASDAARFLPIDKMDAKEFAEMEDALSDHEDAQFVAALGPLTNEDRAENLAELFEAFGLTAEVKGNVCTLSDESAKINIAIPVTASQGKLSAFGPEMETHAAIAQLAKYFLLDVDDVASDARGFDW